MNIVKLLTPRCGVNRQIFWSGMVQNYSVENKYTYPSGPRTVKKKPYIHQTTIRRKMNEEPDTILKILELELNDNLSSSEQARIGSKGSLCINREQFNSIPKGIWYNFETDGRGDMFDLVKIIKNLSHQEMIDFSIEKILPSLESIGDGTEKSIQVEDEELSSELVEKQKQRDSYSRRIVSELLPIAGTIAEDYLKDHRNISLISSKSLKYHPCLSTKARLGGYLNNIPGLVSIASHPRSDKVNFQVTYLDPSTNNKHPDVAISKQTFGSFTDRFGYHYCEISENVCEKVTFLAEGVETALSVHQVFQDNHVIATLGKMNFARIDPEICNKKVVLVFDNDGNDIWEDRLFMKAAKRLIDMEKDVYIVFPPIIEGLDKTDMNDFLVHLGDEGVYKVILNNMKKVKL